MTSTDNESAAIPESVAIPAIVASHNAQVFFEELSRSTRAPHHAEKQREWVRELLKRAQEAGIYTPEES